MFLLCDCPVVCMVGGELGHVVTWMCELLCFLVWWNTSGTHQDPVSLLPSPYCVFLSSSIFLNLTIVSQPPLLLFVYYNLTHLLCFLAFSSIASPSPLPAVEWWCAVVSTLRGIISVVWERSNLTCPVWLKEGCVRSDLSHTARILPSHETSGLPSPSRPPLPPSPLLFTIINQIKMLTPWFASM